ncbi:MAG: fumarylacetoacetase [Burkholderiales bacterium]|nr:fumarylacetoacetase [Burkholderiales bacterium]
MIDETHDPALTSWVPGAETAGGQFPIQNLPFGAFMPASEDVARIGVAIGDGVLDLRSTAEHGLLGGLGEDVIDACRRPTLNEVMALGAVRRRELRLRLSQLLRAHTVHQRETKPHLHRRVEVRMVLPVNIGDYTDFYTSIHHASNVGRLFRPDSPLYPNFTHLPVAYHGRASSVVVSGNTARRPWGQLGKHREVSPVFAPTQKLDFELELGVLIGTGNPLGEPILTSEVEEHVFGMCLVNDWSARDIQAWEYQPLGPFLGKNFLTSVSPWIVTIDALAPFRVDSPERSDRHPTLPYLRDSLATGGGALAIEVEVAIETETMRRRAIAPASIGRARFAEQYWTIFQMIAHHTSNGCNLRTGDLLGSGTISGSAVGEEGCLLEKTNNGVRSFALPSGEMRTYLEDGDEVIMSANCVRDGYVPIGFGECRGRVAPPIHYGSPTDCRGIEPIEGDR